jgi:4-hydroxythreonine-4-phosphate dehydrogenase
MAGVHYPGHTVMLAEFFESPKSAMLFDGPSLRVVLATVHIPLAHVPTRLSTPRIAECIDLASQACREAGIAAPRVAAAGLNPHAGEHGLFGDEDARLIAPAVAAARAAGIDAHGPIPGDVVFLHAVKGRYHAVVAMYHDQGLIPVKLLDRERTVNVTAGLAWRGRGVVRTSPAHGTAFDIAGTGTADPASMHRAAELALTLMARAGAAPHT